MADDKIKLDLELAVKNFNKGLADANKRIDGFSKNFQGQSKKNSVAWGSFMGVIAGIGVAAAVKAIGQVTGALVDLGAESLQAASDAEETLNKFSVVFQDVSEESDKMAKDLAKNYGLARSEARALLADTGDLLTGFGFTGEAALDLSGQVQRLAVDLASFSNFAGGAEGASQALTKALLGERESVKALGISIQEEDVKKEVARLKTEGMTFATERQAKAQATLNIAIRQSQNAIGDFARSQDSYANQTRILESRIKDLKEGIGATLLPVATAAKRGFIALIDAMDVDKIRQFVANGIVAVIEGLQTMTNYVNPAYNAMKALGNAFLVVKNIADIWRATIVEAWASVYEVILGAVEGIIGGIQSLPDFMLPDSWEEGLENFKTGVSGAKDSLGEFADEAANDRKEQIRELTEALDGLGNSFKNTFTEEDLAKVKENLNNLITEVDKAGKAEIKATNKNNKGKSKENKTHLDGMKKQQASYEDELLRGGKKFKSWEESTNKERVANQKETLGRIATLAQSNNKELAAIGKAAAITQATIDGFAAVQKALAAAPPPFNFVLAGLVGAATAANVANIVGVKFAEGGVVPGSSFTGDTVNAQLNSGEVVLNRPQQSELLQIARGGGNAGNNAELIDEIRLLRSAIISQPVILVADDNEIARSASRGVQNGVIIGETN